MLMVLVGIIGLSRLALEQFPEIAPPTVRVMASYTGANAETVQKSVIVPLEEAINGVEGMMYMTSSASNNGTASIGIFFRQGTDPNMAMVNVQNRAATVQGRLPSDVVKSGLTVRKRQTSNIKQIAVYSPDSTFDRSFLANYTKINIEPRLSRIPGVGEVNVMGADYSMRIWLDPLKMARYGLTPADVAQVLNEQNVEVATGTLGAESDNTFQYVLKYRGRYEEEQEYENLVVRSLPDGDVLRIGDIARVELGSQNYNILGETNGSPGINISINQVAGSNANEIIKQIDAEVEEIRHSLPLGIVIEDLESKKDFLDASIASVVETLFEALVLVILVVWLFLGSWRATIIPAIAIVVSLIATLAVIYAIGFSLNMLTLFALVLVIGTVVDDAIVVVEAVQAQYEKGECRTESVEFATAQEEEGTAVANSTPYTLHSKLKRYYQRDWFDYEAVKDNKASVQAIHDALEDAVKRQLMSDVPYGVLLSGGLDSSVISAIAEKFSEHRIEDDSKTRAYWPRLHSFAVGLKGAPDLAKAKLVADHIGTVHHEINYTIQEGLDAIRDVIYFIETYDVTTVRASTPMYLLARVIKSMGIKMVLSGEGADEIFGGYLYFHKAPTAKDFHDETVRKLSKLYMYDCLRANKSLSAWGVEGRVPFLDKEFLDVAMRTNPEAKMCPGKTMEKKIVREAFADMLPEEVAWRQKEQFSDGVGYSWIDTLKQITSEAVSDEQMAHAAERFPINPPKNKEEYYYRSIFAEHFPSDSAAMSVPSEASVACSTAIALEWDAAFKNMNDPSGRAVKGVHEQAYK